MQTGKWVAGGSSHPYGMVSVQYVIVFVHLNLEIMDLAGLYLMGLNNTDTTRGNG